MTHLWQTPTPPCRTQACLLQQLRPHSHPLQNALPIPDRLWLSAEKLDPEGVILLENGFEAFIHVGKNVVPDTLAALFGVCWLQGWAIVFPACATPSSHPGDSRCSCVWCCVALLGDCFAALK
jgi:hypothetical protein